MLHSVHCMQNPSHVQCPSSALVNFIVVQFYDNACYNEVCRQQGFTFDPKNAGDLCWYEVLQGDGVDGSVSGAVKQHLWLIHMKQGGEVRSVFHCELNAEAAGGLWTIMQAPSIYDVVLARLVSRARAQRQKLHQKVSEKIFGLLLLD